MPDERDRDAQEQSGTRRFIGIWPRDIFDQDGPGDGRCWTCVRTRPNWDKRFARWLLARDYGFFLPTVERETFSGGKRRKTDLPLMPGYVFVVGVYTKHEFVNSSSVVRTLGARTSEEGARLHWQLWQLWKALQTVSPLEIAEPLKQGREVEINAGSLKGIIGHFQSWKNKNILVLRVDMLGSDVAFEIPASFITVLEE